MFIYYFEVEVNDKNFEHGLIISENFSKVLKKLTDYYGEENIIDVRMKIISCEN